MKAGSTEPEVLAQAIVDRARVELEALADPAKAPQMAAYMKTAMPFFGVQKAGRDKLQRRLKRDFPIVERDTYVASILALWREPERELKYMAISLAQAWPSFVDRKSLPLFECLIREGAWWDFVDDLAIRLVGKVWADDRSWTEARMDAWIDDEDLWIRRAALIGQIKHKQATDSDRLFDYCRRRAHEREFFIRKAIGWALREYSKTAPEAVRDFLRSYRDQLSGLSYREGAKQLLRHGYAL